jgi:hypothetical protein
MKYTVFFVVVIGDIPMMRAIRFEATDIAAAETRFDEHWTALRVQRALWPAESDETLSSIPPPEDAWFLTDDDWVQLTEI